MLLLLLVFSVDVFIVSINNVVVAIASVFTAVAAIVNDSLLRNAAAPNYPALNIILITF